MEKKKKDERSWSVRGLTWGTTNYKILVKVSWYRASKEQMEGEDWSWVTSIDNGNKTFEYKPGEPAYESQSLSYALDFVGALGMNGYNASVVLMPTWTDERVFRNPKESIQEKWFKETFIKKEEEK